MADPLPLDDPRWRALATDGLSIDRVLDGLRRLYRDRRFGRAGFDLTAGTLHQSTVYASALAVTPHVVAVAEELPTTVEAAEAWIALGALVAAFSRAGERVEGEVPDGVLAGFRASLPAAERCAVACLAEATLDGEQTAALCLASLALGGHRAGRFLWETPEPPGHPLALFLRVACPRCDAETEFLSLAEGVAPLDDLDHPPTDPDATQPDVSAPVVDASALSPRAVEAWSPIARRLGERAEVALPAAFTEAARTVVAMGVPREATERAALTLPAVMVARRGDAVWARCLARLASEMRCPSCREVWPAVEGVA